MRNLLGKLVYILALGFATSALVGQKPLLLRAADKSQLGMAPIGINKLDKSGLGMGIKVLIDAPKKYSIVHFKEGLLMDSNCVIALKRYGLPVYAGLKIGTSLSEIRTVLGKERSMVPSSELDALRYFYFSSRELDVLVAVDSADIAQAYAIQSKQIKVLDGDLLKDVLQALEYKDLEEMWDLRPKWAMVFDDVRHINGGGTYARSSGGLAITSFVDEIKVEVFADYQGPYYMKDGGKVKLMYLDREVQNELMVERMDLALRHELLLKKYPMYTPSGKFKSTYVFNFGSSYYMLMRKVDFSEQDRYVFGVRMLEGLWLDDQNFLYKDDIDQSWLLRDINKDLEAIPLNDLLQGMDLSEYTVVEQYPAAIGLKHLQNGGKIYLKYENGAEGMKFEKIGAAPSGDMDVLRVDLWEHPVKSVFEAYRLQLVKVQLKQSKVYPVFHVAQLPSGVADDSKFIEQLGKKNFYWDYSLTDGDVKISVRFDRSKKALLSVDKGVYP